MILQVTDGACLVGAHQRAIASNVSGKNCRQPAENLRIFARLWHCRDPIRHRLVLPSTSPIALGLTFGSPTGKDRFWKKEAIISVANSKTRCHPAWDSVTATPHGPSADLPMSPG